MTRFKVTKWLLSTAILSMSLLTVMAGAAIAPALGVIQAHFANTSPLLIQMLISIPALFIILTSFVFPTLCRHYNTRTLVLASLAVYVIAGSGAFFLKSLWIILILRALVGLSVGVIMPLSTGLLAFYFAPDKQAKLMGLSSSMNYLGGVVATLITGILSNISWNCSFLVYLMGLSAFALCAFYMPANKLPVKEGSTFSRKNLQKYQLYIFAMLLVMPIFFIHPTNFAILASRDGIVSSWLIAPIMAILDVIAFVMGLMFAWIFRRMGRYTYFLPPFFYALGYIFLLISPSYIAVVFGSGLVGVGSGIGIPLIMATASRKAGPLAATTVMPLLSATMYIGQFLTPFAVSWGGMLFPGCRHKAYAVALVLTLLLVINALQQSRKERMTVRM